MISNLFADVANADKLREKLASIAFDDTACDAADAAHDAFITAHDRAVDALNGLDNLSGKV
jgi:hypothetical protein